MKLWQKLFANLHTDTETRTIWRERFSHDWGKNNNHVYILKDGQRRECHGIIPGLALRIEGHDNCIEIHESCEFSKCDLWITGHHNRVQFGEHARLTYLSVRIPDNNRLFAWGAHSTCEKVRCFVQVKDLIVGNNCMFSDLIEIMTSDGHSVLDKNTRHILNNITGQMKIGNHVWVGRRVFLTKNTQIADDCIVGACAVVTKPFTETNCVIAGFPAKIVKQGITWEGTEPMVYAANQK